MEREERRRADALDRYWDAIQRGESSVSASGMDEAAEAVIHYLGVQRAISAPAGARTRVRARLAAHARELEGAQSTGGARLPGLSGALSPPFRPSIRPATSHLGWAVARLAGAFLLLLTIAFSAVMLWPGRPFADRPSMLPAPTDMSTGVLLDLTIPEQVVPRWQVAVAALFHASIPPNSTTNLESTMLRVDFTVQGQYAMRSDVPVAILRAEESTPKEIPPGTEVALNPGDAMISPPDSVLEIINRESNPAEVLSWYLMKDTSSRHNLPRSWVVHASEFRDSLFPQAGPIAFHLQRVDLAPDATIPAPPNMLQMAVTVSENAKDYTVARTRDGGRRNLGKEPVTMMVVTIGAAESVSLMP